jgi:hypothetical protein
LRAGYQGAATGTGGLIEIAIPASAMAGLTAAETLYADVQGVDTAGKRGTLAVGTIAVLLDVTRATS